MDLERYKRYVSVEDMQVPVLSLDYEYQAYTELGRLERAHMIKDALEQLQNRARE